MRVLYSIDDSPIAVSVHLLAYWAEQIFRNNLYGARFLKVERDEKSGLITTKRVAATDDKAVAAADNFRVIRETVEAQMSNVVKIAYGHDGNPQLLERAETALRQALDVSVVSLGERTYTTESAFHYRTRFLPNQIALNPRIGAPLYFGGDDEPVYVAKRLVSDKSLFKATQSMSTAIGPVIWEFIRLVTLHYQSDATFDYEKFLGHVSAAFTTCVCGSNALMFLKAHDALRTNVPHCVRKVCGPIQVTPSAHRPWSLLQTMHEKIKFNSILRNDISAFRNYVFGARKSALKNSKQFFDPEHAGIKDETGFINLRMYFPVYSVRVLEDLLNRYVYANDGDIFMRRRYYVQPCYINEMQVPVKQDRSVLDSPEDVMTTFFKISDLATDDDVVVSDGVQYVASSDSYDAYVLSDQSVEYLYSGIGNDRGDDAESAARFVELLKNRLGVHPQWSTCFLLWWSAMSHRCNGPILTDRTHVVDLYDAVEESTYMYRLAFYNGSGLTLCHPNLHKDFLCAVVNSVSFLRVQENLTALWSYSRGCVISGAEFFERVFALLRIWLFNSFGTDFYEIMEEVRIATK